MYRRPISWFTSAALLASVYPAPSLGQPAIPPIAANTAPVAVAAAGMPGYNHSQLDAVLAPIALYPDVLLTQVMMAASYPSQILEAGRWVQRPANRNLRGDDLAHALEANNWDPSVKSLVPFPALLSQLGGNRRWLEQLGYAAANQQADVLDSVQRLRAQAIAAGTLQTTDQCVVRTEDHVVYIDPPASGLVYLPTYNPTSAYGTWAEPANPPVYLPPPAGYVFSPVLGGILAFGAGVAVGALLWDIGRPNWGQHHIYINRDHYNAINGRYGSYRGGDAWHPSQTATYSHGGGWRYPPGMTGSSGRGTGQGGYQGHGRAQSGDHGKGHGDGMQGHGQATRQHGGHGQEQEHHGSN